MVKRKKNDTLERNNKILKEKSDKEIRRVEKKFMKKKGRKK